jgi:hypothetical protein
MGVVWNERGVLIIIEEGKRTDERGNVEEVFG